MSLLPALELSYNTSQHAVTGKAPFELERGWLPRTPLDYLTASQNVELAAEPSADSFAKMIESAREHASQCVSSAFEEHKRRWDAHHKDTPLKEGDEVLISTKHFGVVGSNKLKDPWVGPFVVSGMVNDNAARLILTPPFDTKHPVFPVSLLKLSKSAAPGIKKLGVRLFELRKTVYLCIR